ncbi:MAG: c-type cytochrome [Acidobacteria bacterium]|nr:c-type cytochrome [Acidobacteriota bacterium]
MRNHGSAVAVALAATIVSASFTVSAAVAGDSRRGAEVFEKQSCVQCHSVNGKGGKLAPDLGRLHGRGFTPSTLASLMWNHAPTMWTAMEKQGTAPPALSEQQAADLFAFFSSARFFERPGDAGRGKQVFAAKHCATCHGISSSPETSAPPIATWPSLGDPIMLAQQMWNHAPKMAAALKEKKLKFPMLSGQELTDLLVYLQNLPETRNLVSGFALSASGNGEALFQQSGCAGCHTGNRSLEGKLRGMTPADIAGAMWNHSPRMRAQRPSLDLDNMREIVSYVWAAQFFGESGDARRGERVFAKKGCAGCHNGSGSAPALAKGHRGFSSVTMISALSRHGPAMLAAMKQQGREWPRFTGPEMANLVSFLAKGK